MTSSADAKQNNAENSSDSQSENAGAPSAPPPDTHTPTPTTTPTDPNTIPLPPTPLTTKQAYRERVWTHLQHHRLAQYPLPARGRIPNIRGSDTAVQRHLAQLAVWQGARSVCVNADKAQEGARAQVLRDGKALYVPVPRVEGGFLRLVRMKEGEVVEEVPVVEGEEGKGPKPLSFKQAVNRRGLEENGITIPFVPPTPTSDSDDTPTPPMPPTLPQLDLVVVGAVGVSRANGRHIGKGRGGYADLEYGILRALGAITDATKIVTVVHDCQVFDELPEDLFGEHDLSVDYIVTPTGVIEVGARNALPRGVYWPLVSNRRLGLMPVLQHLREQQQSADVDVTLKADDTDIESTRDGPRMRRRFVRRRRNAPRSASQGQPPGQDGGAQATNGGGAGGPSADGKENVKPRRRMPPHRFYRRPRTPKEGGNNVTDSSTERGRDGATSSTQQPRGGPNNRFRRPFRLPPHIIDFSLKVSNIERSVRVRDLKQALVERGIKPHVITWVGYKGFCLLHYAKPRPPRAPRTTPIAAAEGEGATDGAPVTEGKGAEGVLRQQQQQQQQDQQVGEADGPEKVVHVMKQFVLDDVIEILQNMRIGPDSETILDVTVMKPSPEKTQPTNVTHPSSPIPTRIETTDVSAV